MVKDMEDLDIEIEDDIIDEISPKDQLKKILRSKKNCKILKSCHSNVMDDFNIIHRYLKKVRYSNIESKIENEYDLYIEAQVNDFTLYFTFSYEYPDYVDYECSLFKKKECIDVISGDDILYFINELEIHDLKKVY